MRIYRTLPTLIVFLIGLFAVPSVFSSNIGRNVYGILSETYNGVQYNASTVDGASLAVWNNFVITDMTDTPQEGSKYNRFTINNTSWAGAGISSPTYNRDMSAYHNGYLKFYARSNNAQMANYEIGIEMTAGQVWKTLTSLGFLADGNWHEISIPLNATTNALLDSANLQQVKQLFMLRGGGATIFKDDAIDIDNIVWVKNATGSFTPRLKRVSDDVIVGTTSGNITWNEGSTTGNNEGWTVADQYIELDLDMYVSGKDTLWNVRIHTENEAIDRNGLMSPSFNHKIPLCWRASDYKLPYEVGSDTRTFTIGEVVVSTTTGAQLYDAGAEPNPNNANYWCWFWMMDKAENHTQDYNIIWDNRGFQGAENTGKFFGMNQTLGIFPKIYLGAKFLNVVGGQTYNATITAEFAYE